MSANNSRRFNVEKKKKMMMKFMERRKARIRTDLEPWSVVAESCTLSRPL